MSDPAVACGYCGSLVPIEDRHFDAATGTPRGNALDEHRRGCDKAPRPVSAGRVNIYVVRMVDGEKITSKFGCRRSEVAAQRAIAECEPGELLAFEVSARRRV